MTLATIPETTSPRRARLRRSGQLALSFDALLMAAGLAICALLFAQGGLETFVFALGGAAIGAHRAAPGLRLQAAYSSGFAGLFVGAMFAAFFHGALVALVQLI